MSKLCKSAKYLTSDINFFKKAIQYLIRDY